MIRKDGPDPTGRLMCSAPLLSTFVGNNRQMLQEIRDSLSHLRKNPVLADAPHASRFAVESMQIKSEVPMSQNGVGNGGSGGVGGGMDPRSGAGTPKSSSYRQKALAEIRNSLLPFATTINSAASTVSTLSSSTTSGVSSASGLSTASGSSSPCPQQNGYEKDSLQRSILQQLLQMGYDEELIIRAMKLSSGRSIEAVLEAIFQLCHEVGSYPGLKIVRRQSFEHDYAAMALQRGSPAAVDSSAASSTRSDSPSMSVQQQQLRSNFATVEGPPRLMASQPSDVACHLPVSRQYSPSFSLDPPPPPPPPPRPPPVSSRGATPPPLPPPPSAAAAAPFLPSSSQVQHMLKRISPVPQTSRPQVGYCVGLSQPSQSSSQQQRGTSPSAAGGRPPIIVPNSPQVQQQINQQLQNFSLYNGSSPVVAHQVEPPPPYPIGSAAAAMQVGAGGKLPSPLPYSPSPTGTPQSRQSPTLGDYPSPHAALSHHHAKRPPAVSLYQTGQISPVSCSSSSNGSTGCGVAAAVAAQGVLTVNSRPMSHWNARQPPIIMQSVKSTQVQKPILQTAIAPTAPSLPCYSTAVQQQQQVCLGDVSPQMTTVPTTDPPSYASTIQALVAQQAMPPSPSQPSSASTTTTVSLCGPGLPAYNLHLHAGGLALSDTSSGISPSCCSHSSSSVAFLQNRSSSALSSAESSVVSSNKSSGFVSIDSLQQQQKRSHVTSVRKYSSPGAGVGNKLPPGDSPDSGSSVSLRSDSPTVVLMPPGRPPPPPPPPASLSADGKGPPPPPPPPPYKTTLHSPIPERKSKLKDDEACETKVKNYSPQAYKFFMEQHMENVFKSRQQRLHRQMQLESEMAKVGLSEEAQCQMRRMLHQKESNYIRLKRAKMEKSMFVKIKAVGVGAFGEVALVRKIDTNHLYAMKTLRKTDVLKRNQVAHVKAERDILAEADNEWVVKLYYSFQDKDNLYFVMDYIPGGDLMSLLIKCGIFEETLARFYVAELVCAIESVHKMGFIHRDIKPDNILIDRDGHIKLTDFGLCTGFRWTHNSKYYQRNGEHGRQDSMDPDESCWSNECHCHDTQGSLEAPNVSSVIMKPLERRRRREHQRCLAHSLVGTPNYIAPEVLLRTGYTQLCDWWSVGVILYEMLVGQPPFFANTPAETQYKVINWENTLRIPKQANLSAEAMDLILKLCTSHDQRLGCNGAQQVKDHAFFAGIDFEGGVRRQRAPYLPTIRFATDTSNFDPVDPDKLRTSDGSDDTRSEHGSDGSKHPEHAFFEFTFRRFFDDGGHAYPTRTGADEVEGQGGGAVFV